MGIFDNFFKKKTPWTDSIATFLKKKVVDEDTEITPAPQPIAPKTNIPAAIPQSKSFQQMANDFANQQSKKAIEQQNRVLSQQEKNRLDNLVSQGGLSQADAMNIDNTYGTDYLKQVNKNAVKAIWSDFQDAVKDAPKNFMNPNIAGIPWLGGVVAAVKPAVSPWLKALWLAYWNVSWWLDDISTADAKKAEKADRYLQQLEDEEETTIAKQIAKEEQEKRAAADKAKLEKAQQDLAIAQTAEDAFEISSNREKYPEEKVVEAIKFLNDNKIVDKDTAMAFTTKLRDQWQKVLDEIAMDEVTNYSTLIGIIPNKEERAQYVNRFLRPSMELSSEEKGTKKWEDRFAAKRAITNSLLNVTSKDAESLYKKGAIDSIDEYYTNGQWTLALTNTLTQVDKFFDETNASETYTNPETWVFDVKKFMADFVDYEGLENASKEYNASLQSAKMDNFAWEKWRWLYTNLSYLTKYPTASLSFATWWGRNIESAAKDISQSQVRSFIRNNITDPFFREAWWFDAASIIATLPTAMPARLTNLARMAPFVDDIFKLKWVSWIEKWALWAWRTAIRWVWESISWVPLDLVLNGFMSEDQINRNLDLWFNLASWLFGPWVALIDDFSETVSRAIQRGEDKASIAQMVQQRYWIPIREEVLESVETARAFVSDMLDTFKWWKRKQAEIMAMTIGQEAASATDQKLLALQENIRNIQNSKLFSDQQKKINNAILWPVLKAKSPEEIRAAFMKFGDQYNVKNYEKFLDMQYKEVASTNLLDNIWGAINKDLRESNINVPDDFGYKIALATFLNPTFMSNKANLKKFINAEVGQEVWEVIAKNSEDIIVESVSNVAKGKADINSPWFVDKIIAQAKKVADSYNKEQSSIAKKWASTSKVKIIEWALASIHESYWDIIARDLKQVKSPEGKMNVVKSAVNKWARNNGFVAEADDYAQILWPWYFVKYVNNPKWYTTDKISFVEQALTKEMSTQLFNMAIPEASKKGTMEWFVSDVVSKLYGKWEVADQIIKWVNDFLTTYNANKTLLINSGVDDAVDGFLVVLPNEWAKQYVLGLWGNLLKQAEDILNKEVLTAEDNAILSKTLWVIMHEVWHIALEAIDPSFKKSLVNTFKRQIITNGQANIEVIAKLLNNNQAQRYVDMIQNGKTEDYVVDEFIADYFSNNFSSYVFDKKGYEDRVATIMATAWQKNMQGMDIAMKSIDEVISNAGEFVKWVLAMAYLTNPKTKSFSSFLKKLQTSSVLGNPDYLKASDAPQVFFKKWETPTAKEADMLAIYSQELSDNVWEWFFKALLNGQGGITNLEQTMSAISKAISSNDAKWIFVDMPYISPSGKMVLDKLFNPQSMSPEGLKVYNDIMVNSKTRELDNSYWLANRIFTRLYDAAANTLTLKNPKDNITNIALKTSAVLSDGSMSARAKKFVWGISFAPLLTLTKYIWIANQSKFDSLYAKAINLNFADNAVVNARFNGNVWESWMALYNDVYKKLLSYGLTDDVVADITHPLIFSADEYIKAVAKSNVTDDVLANALIGVLRKKWESKILYAVKDIDNVIDDARELIEKNMYKWGDVASKNLSITKMENALTKTIDDIQNPDELVFGISPSRMDEYLYKMYYKNFGAAEWQATIVADLTNAIWDVVKKDGMPITPENTKQITAALDDISVISGDISKGIGKGTVELLEWAVKRLSDIIESLPFESQFDKQWVIDMIDGLKNTIGNGNTFQDIARDILIKNIKKVGGYTDEAVQAIQNNLDEEILDIVAKKDELLKQRIDIDKTILKESLTDYIVNLPWDEKFDNIIKWVNAIASDEGIDLPKKLQEMSSVARAITNMLEGKKWAVSILKNQDMLDLFNKNILDVYGDVDDAIYHIFYKNHKWFVGTKLRYNKPVVSWFMWQTLERCGNSFRMARAILADDPESSSILGIMDKNARELKFKNKSALWSEKANKSLSGYEYFTDIWLKLRELTAKTNFAQTKGAWDAALSEFTQWYRKDISYVPQYLWATQLNDKQKELYRFFYSVLNDIKSFRQLNNLWDIPLEELSKAWVSNVWDMINRLWGPWNYTSYDDFSRLLAKYNTDNSNKIPWFLENTLFSGIRDTAEWLSQFRLDNLFLKNNKLTSYLRNFVYLKNYNLLGYNRFINDAAVNIIDAESTFNSVALVDPKLIDDISKKVWDAIDFHLSGSGKMWDIESVEFGPIMSKIFEYGNVLRLADKASMPAAMRMAVAVWLYDIVETYGTKEISGSSDVIDFFSKRIEDFQAFQKETGISESDFLSRQYPWDKLFKYAKAKNIPLWKATDDYNDYMSFFHDKYNPFLEKAKTALTTFYAFDNMPEMWVVSAVARAPWMFWLMKWAITKSTELWYGIAKEIQNKWIQKFLADVAIGESKLINKYVGMAALAARTAHGIDRLTWWEESEGKIMLSFMAPAIAIQMWVVWALGKAVNTWRKWYEDTQDLQKSIWLAVQDFLYSMQRRGFIYHNAVAQLIVDVAWVWLNAESKSFDAVWKSIVYNMVWKTLMSPYYENVSGIGYLSPNTDTNFFLKQWLFNMKYDTKSHKALERAINATWVQNAYNKDWQYKTDPTDLLWGTPIIGPILQGFAWWGTQRQVNASMLADYMEDKQLASLFNSYVNRDILWGLLNEYDAYDLEAKYNETNYIMPAEWALEDAIKKWLITINAYAPSTKVLLEPLLMKAGAGNDIRKMNVLAITPQKVAEYAELFDLIGNTVKKPGAFRPSDIQIGAYIASANKMGTAYTTAQMMDALIVYNYKQLEAIYISDDATTKNMVKYMAENESWDLTQYIKDNPLSDKATAWYTKVLEDSFKFQEELVKEFWPFLSRNDAVPQNFITNYLGVATDSPVSLEGKMDNPQSVMAQYGLLKTLDMAVDSNGQPNSILTAENAVALKHMQSMWQMSRKEDEDEDEYQARLTRWLSIIDSLQKSINLSSGSPASRETAKTHIALMAYPFINALSEKWPAFMKSLLTKRWEWDSDAWLQKLGSSLNQLVESEPASIETSFELATGIDLWDGKGWGKKYKASPKEDKFAIEVLKAKNAIAEFIWKLQSIGFKTLPPLRYENRKGAGIRPTKVTFKPEREQFAREYANRWATWQQPESVTTPDLPVKSSRIIGWRVGVSNIRNAKVYSKPIRI